MTIVKKLLAQNHKIDSKSGKTYKPKEKSLASKKLQYFFDFIYKCFPELYGLLKMYKQVINYLTLLKIFGGCYKVYHDFQKSLRKLSFNVYLLHSIFSSKD